jgi:hypothetical protein
MNAVLLVFATFASLNCGGDSSAATANPGRAIECEDTEIRLAALQALHQIQSDKFVPTLKKLYERRDSCSTVLRRRALEFLSPEEFNSDIQSIVISAATTDPDPDVRKGAIDILTRDTSAAATAALGKALASTEDQEVQQNALSAISMRTVTGARKHIRDFAMQTGVSEEMRGQAIGILGNVAEPEPPQNDRHMDRYNKAKAEAKTITTESAGYLREIYPKLETQQLKQQVLSTLAQFGGPENMSFIANLVGGDDQLETRQSALHLAIGNEMYGAGHDGKGPLGVTHAQVTELVAVYDRLKDRSLKQELVGYFGQRKDDPAFKKLVAIAKGDKDSAIRQAAIDALSSSPHPGSKEALADLVAQ